MSRSLTLSIAAVALIGALVLLGPRARVEPGLLSEPVMGVLDDWTTDDTPGVTRGAEKGIVWADSSRARTALALVYLHGFSATRREVHPLVDTLGARLGANVFYTRLTGHGFAEEGPGEIADVSGTGRRDALGDATADDWLRDTAEAIAVGGFIGDQVVLVGTSTGGTLAALAGVESTVHIAAIVLLSPNFGPFDAQAEKILWPWGRQLTRLLAGERREWTPANAAQEEFWTTRYGTRVLPEMMAVVEAARSARLESIQAPVYVVYSGRDQVISVDRLEEAVRRIPRAEWWDITAHADSARAAELSAGSFHVVAGDILAPGFTPIVADSIEAFLRRVLR